MLLLDYEDNGNTIIAIASRFVGLAGLVVINGNFVDACLEFSYKFCLFEFAQITIHNV